LSKSFLGQSEFFVGPVANRVLSIAPAEVDPLLRLVALHVIEVKYYVRVTRGGQRSDTGAPRACLLRQRVSAGLGDLRVLLRGGSGDTNRTDDFAIHDEWNPTFKGTGAG
jgi:hypothetical protein